MAAKLHDDELPINMPLVRALVDRSYPELSSLPLRRFERFGSSNALFRLGDELLVRLARQPGSSPIVEKVARWLPMVGSHLPVAVPEIVAVGEPGFGYPENWSIVRWLEGSQAASVPETAVESPRTQLARDLVELVSALRAIDVPRAALQDATLHGYRGDPLITRDVPTRGALATCRSIDELDGDLDAASCVWQEAMCLAGNERVAGPHWYHGDLFAENILVSGGRLAAVLDWDGLATGDPTIDLMVAWEVLDPAARSVFRDETGVDERSWLRARAWALSIALVCLPYYWRTMPDRCASKVAVVDAVLKDAGF